MYAVNHILLSNQISEKIQTCCRKIVDQICESSRQGGHGTGKTGNLAVNFSRQGKHRELSKFNFLHRENCGNTGKILKI